MSTIYTPCLIYINGQLVFQNQRISVSQPNNDEDVATIPGGVQGPAPGPDQTNITITNAVPKGGRKINFSLLKRNRTVVDVRIVQIGVSEELVGKFIVKEVQTDSAAGSATVDELQISSVGSPAPIWE